MQSINNMPLYTSIPNWMQEIPDHLKTQEMCADAVHIKPYSLKFVPDCFKTQEVCDKAVEGGYMHWNTSRSVKDEGNM